VNVFRLVANPHALRAAGLFAAEGRWVVQRLLMQRRFVTRTILVTAPARASLLDNVPAAILGNVPMHCVSQERMDELVGFNMHRGCLALAERPPEQALTAARLGATSRVVVLEGVNNPDNVGGIFRSAAAFDVDLVVLGPACGDPLYRKAIRTSMAATLDVPFVSAGRWPEALDLIRAAGLHLIALSPAPDARPLEMESPRDRIALLLGTEGAGLTDEAANRAAERIRIRTSDRVDSLNVTVAASIALHHFAR
jgi:tRNA G18 (ribose-2'-O)-methylase SpoU